MSLVIEYIEFQNYRNYQNFKLVLPNNLLIIIGDNAVGKTNIIEGIQLMTMLSSFRNPAWEEVALNKLEKCYIRFYYKKDNRDIELTLEVIDNKRTYYLNGKKKQPNAIQGLLPSVLFTPEDLDIIKGSAEMRRNNIDAIGIQLSKTYSAIRLDYQKVVKQKNALLKEKIINKDLIESWNQNLAHLGALYFLNRFKLFKRMMNSTQRIYPTISPEEQFSFSYIPSFIDFLDEKKINNLDNLSIREIEQLLLVALKEKLNNEFVRGKSLIGPHRDDIKYLINEKDARIFGSQGQQRTLILALKIAEIQTIREITSTEPILLLDDVMSELDESRRNALLNIINENNYTFITTTNLGYFDNKILQKAQILNLSEDSKGVVRSCR